MMGVVKSALFEKNPTFLSVLKNVFVGAVTGYLSAALQTSLIASGDAPTILARAVAATLQGIINSIAYGAVTPREKQKWRDLAISFGIGFAAGAAVNWPTPIDVPSEVVFELGKSLFATGAGVLGEEVGRLVDVVGRFWDELVSKRSGEDPGDA